MIIFAKILLIVISISFGAVLGIGTGTLIKRYADDRKRKGKWKLSDWLGRVSGYFLFIGCFSFLVGILNFSDLFSENLPTFKDIFLAIILVYFSAIGMMLYLYFNRDI